MTGSVEFFAIVTLGFFAWIIWQFFSVIAANDAAQDADADQRLLHGVYEALKTREEEELGRARDRIAELELAVQSTVEAKLNEVIKQQEEERNQ